MPFNINDFHSNISKTGGAARVSSFDAFITPPAGLEDFQDVVEGFRFRINNINYPARNIKPLTFNDYGPIKKFGGPGNYIDLTMGIILSPDFRERDFFLSWQDKVVGKHRVQFDGAQDVDEQKIQFDIGYAQDYLSDAVTINQYWDADDSKPLYSVKLIDAYPLAVEAVGASWLNTEISTMNVLMSYRYFVDKSKPRLPNQKSNRRAPPFLASTGLGGLIGVGAGVVAGRLGTKKTAAVMAAGQVIRSRIT